jgi:large subunit ribosomal protein L24
MKTKIKKGDTVKVISGAHKGEQGTVLEVLPQAGRVRIEGVAPIKRHIKPQKNPKHPEGGIIEGAGSVDLSNVMLVSEKLGRPVRTGAAFTADSTKQRVVRGRNLKAEVV